MKRAVKTCCAGIMLVGIVLFTVHTASAQAPKVALSSIQVDFSEVNRLWFQALNYLQNGELLEANLKLADLNQEKLRVGLYNLPVHSAILIREAQKFKERRNYDNARTLLESAQLLSPDSSSVYFASARLRFAQKFTDFYGIFWDTWRGLYLKYTDINTIITFVNNGLSSLLLTGMVTSAVFLLFSFIYYRRAIFYQIKGIFPIELPTLIAHVIGWIAFGVVTLGLGIFWGMLFLAFLLLWQVDLSSKRVLQLVLVFGVVLTGVLLIIGMTFSAFEGEYFQALCDISNGEYSSRTTVVLQERLKEYPDDVYAMFGLAYIAQKTGNIQGAIEAYEMIAGQYPDLAAVQNNLGNLYQHQFQATEQKVWFQRAEEAYKNAIYYNAKMFEGHYNFGQLLLRDFERSEEASTELQEARKIDGLKYTLYSEKSGRKDLLIEAPFSTIALLKKLYAKDFFSSATMLAEYFWSSGSRFKNPWYFSIASGVLLVLSCFFGVKKKKPKQGVLYCQMCGDPYSVKRKKSQEPQTFCTQCTYIFKKKTVVKPEKRETKIKQIQLRQKARSLLAKVSSLCFPGTGQIYYGYPVKGVLLSFLFSFGGVVYLLKEFLKTLLDPLGGIGLSWGTMIVLAVLFFGTYLFNIYDILRLSPKNQ